MHELPTPADIESRAKAADIPMAELCRRAGIAPSTWKRWKGGITSPTLDIVRKLIDAIPSNERAA